MNHTDNFCTLINFYMYSMRQLCEFTSYECQRITYKDYYTHLHLDTIIYKLYTIIFTIISYKYKLRTKNENKKLREDQRTFFWLTRSLRYCTKRKKISQGLGASAPPPPSMQTCPRECFSRRNPHCHVCHLPGSFMRKLPKNNDIFLQKLDRL